MEGNSENSTSELSFSNNTHAMKLFGEKNLHLTKIADALAITIHARGNKVILQGDEVARKLATNLLNQLYSLVKEGLPLYASDIDHAIKAVSGDPTVNLKTIFMDTVFITATKRPITPKSLNQKAYIDAIRGNDIVFGIGPAGTGKTYLAMAMAVATLVSGRVNRIILTRPAVEAGESLGFLPGGLADKVDPYLRPLYDALHDMLRYEKVAELMEQGAIEVAPLAFMRGRTLNNAFIILDEAQNTTSEQMKMFLTRIGFNSKAVITGDVTQVDLPASKIPGLKEAHGILTDIPGISFVEFSKEDVVRHKLVMEIISAYEKNDLSKRRRTEQAL
jgi:phosphate starvation-inducible PhoH-like protein